MARVVQQPTSVLDYLRQCVSPAALSDLYSDVFTSVTIFRALPMISRLYVMRLLFLDDFGVPRSTVDQWCMPGAEKEHQQALTRLFELSLLTERKDRRRGSGTCFLHPVFQRALRMALTNQLPDYGSSSLSKDKRAPSLKMLKEYAETRWESILNFLVGIASPVPVHAPSHVVAATTSREVLARLVKENGFMRTGPLQGLALTSEGFRFLFRSRHRQVWLFVLNYLSSLSRRNMRPKEVLAFLLRLSFLTVGKDYPTAALTATQKVLMQDLLYLGLVYQRKPSSRRFYPTPLARNLAAEEAKEHVELKGGILVETTFSVYAYLHSRFQLSLLQLFLRVDYKLPNLIVGKLTKASLRHAWTHGIKGQDILDYLELYAHPEMRKNNPLLPSNVVDQVRLWEASRKRFTLTSGTLLHSFHRSKKRDEFGDLLTFARAKDMVVHSDEKRRYIVLKPKHMPAVRTFCEKQRTLRAPEEAEQ